MENEKKYYWLKLDRNFFKRHDIKIVESMKNGESYILFYMKLLVESIDHEGSLRFNEAIPYNEDMLSVITGTSIDIVRSAMKIFLELNLISVLDDATIFMNEVNKMLGEGKSTDRVRRFREKQKQLLPRNVTETLHETEKEIEKELDKDIDIDKNKIRFFEESNNESLSKKKKRKPRSEKQEASEEVIEIIEFLNKKAGRSFKPQTESFIKLINDRVDEGYTLNDFKSVIMGKVKLWKGKEQEQYLRPSTLFSSLHFAEYLGSVPQYQEYIFDGPPEDYDDSPAPQPDPSKPVKTIFDMYPELNTMNL